MKDYRTLREVLPGLARFLQWYQRQRPHQAPGVSNTGNGVFRCILMQTILNFASNCLDNGIHLQHSRVWSTIQPP